MIRLALSIHLVSPAALQLLRDTGMVKLPCSRTLFDYSHARPSEAGIDKVVLESLAKRVDKLKRCHKFHVLMGDEMYISQNLIFQKSSGKLIGYTNLDDVDKEVQRLENYLDNFNEDLEETIASKVLVFMVKGVSSGIKEVVATFPVNNPSVNQMYIWLWQVIGALEKCGIPIIAYVSDGFSVNRALIRKHKPFTKTDSGIIFDTINKAAPHRVLYFVSDVPHLLKTIRNCLYNSRSDKRKGRRRMSRNGKKITWDFIIDLYELHKKKNLRKSFKLNAMNVYPDSYGRMKVKYAAQILSDTVAQDLEDRQWSGATELIKFIRMVNKWFDCLNGAHTIVSKKTRNKNFEAYTKKSLDVHSDDKRFQFLEEFLEDLRKWKEEAYSQNVTLNSTMINESVANLPAEDTSEVFEGSDSDDNTPSSKRILSRETLEGIEISTRAIMAAIKFLLDEGVDFINARVFTQDPLEQHFSKLRAGHGGSSNPNVLQVVNRNRAIHTSGEIGMKRRRGNAAESSSSLEVTSEPLPKRKTTHTPKFGATVSL